MARRDFVVCKFSNILYVCTEERYGYERKVNVLMAISKKNPEKSEGNLQNQRQKG